MLYLSRFKFADVGEEEQFVNNILETCYDSFYPFGVLSAHGFEQIRFAPLTILYGGNGSGKTTALNVIAEKIGAQRDSLYNRSVFYEDYLRMCAYEKGPDRLAQVRIITSDDVFDYMLNIRSLNEGLDQRRADLVQEHLEARYASFKLQSLDDYDALKKVMDARRNTRSRYVRRNLMDAVKEQSNGESAFMYFTEKIRDNGLYLLDEPENSLSPVLQMQLAEFLEQGVRFFGCQIIMATHSPFLLSMKGARIYDLDEIPVDVKRWMELPNVRTYYDFFMRHREDFT